MMNKKAGQPSLTWLLIGIVIFIGVILLIYSPSWGIYNGLLNANGISVDEQYAGIYGNLSSDMQNVTSLSDNLIKPSNIWSIFSNTGIAFVNTLAIGLSSIGLLIQIPTYMSHVVTSLQGVSGIPTPFWWILLTTITIYGAAKFIQALRGTSQEP